jgi:hypothetical protein
MAPGKFKRTKVIIFSSRYILINRTNFKLFYKEEGSKNVFEIEKDDRINLFGTVLKKEQEKSLIFKIEGNKI